MRLTSSIILRLYCFRDYAHESSFLELLSSSCLAIDFRQTLHKILAGVAFPQMLLSLAVHNTAERGAAMWALFNRSNYTIQGALMPSLLHPLPLTIARGAVPLIPFCASTISMKLFRGFCFFSGCSSLSASCIRRLLHSARISWSSGRRLSTFSTSS